MTPPNKASLRAAYPLSPEGTHTEAKSGEIPASHPILFSGAMVRAILEGRKTQTRRIVTVPWHKGKKCLPYEPYYIEEDCKLLYMDEAGDYHPMEELSPYGRPGERLWVRETWAMTEGYGDDADTIYYKANNSAAFFEDEKFHSTWEGIDADSERKCNSEKWKPSIFMPRWASRITLEIVGVRVERLQQISGKDILAEGAVVRAHDDQFGHNPVSAFDGKLYMDLKSLWAAGWDSINKKRGFGWDVNPWLWAIEFRRINA